ncbi:MAG TPA: hypothetical protein VHS07_03925 [Candidatus Binataceae bacterium]|nr:hypothetical protein [Candidatus Binataceae bacterium]
MGPRAISSPVETRYQARTWPKKEITEVRETSLGVVVAGEATTVGTCEAAGAPLGEADGEGVGARDAAAENVTDDAGTSGEGAAAATVTKPIASKSATGS